MVIALVLGYGQKADGSIDEQTRDRCQRAVELYRQQKINVIFLTVSASKNGVSMADAMKEYLVKQDVFPSDVFVDRRGGNTAGEIDVFLVTSNEELARPERVIPRFLNLDLFRPVQAIFISTWYHIPRIVWLAWWRGRWNEFSVAAAWRHAHWRADVLKEVLKLAYAIIRPRQSSKIVRPTPAI